MLVVPFGATDRLGALDKESIFVLLRLDFSTHSIATTDNFFRRFQNALHVTFFTAKRTFSTAGTGGMSPSHCFVIEGEGLRIPRCCCDSEPTGQHDVL